MKKVDTLIVGDGFAAMFLSLELLAKGKTVALYSEQRKGASRVSAGMVNPVVLKKFTTFDNALPQIEKLRSVLSYLLELSGVDTIVEQPLHRIFHDAREKTLWLEKATQEPLSTFLSEEIIQLPGVLNPHGSGKVLHSFRVDVEAFFFAMEAVLGSRDMLFCEHFSYDELHADQSCYKDVYFTNLVFAQGHHGALNPFFPNLHIHPNKGHHLKVRLDSPVDLLVKKKHFLFPLSEGYHYYGGTYDRTERMEKIDEKAVGQLTEGLKEFYAQDFSVEEVGFGFRPTVRDRRPLLGASKEYPNFYVFNGLGARGLLNGAWYAQVLSDHLLTGKEIPLHARWERFDF